MYKKLFVPLIAALILCTACEKQIYFEIEDTDPLVVINCVAQPDSALSARITLSRFFLDQTRFKVVNDADITLTVNGQPTGPATFVNGRYSIPCIPHEGDTLHVDVRVPGRTPISAGTRIPYSPQVSSLDVVYQNISSNYEGRLNFTVTLRDRPGEKVGYRLSAYIIDTVDIDTVFIPDIDYSSWPYDTLGYDTILPHTEVETYSLWMESDDPIISSGVGLEDIGDIIDFKSSRKDSEHQFFYFPDDSFDGQSHQFFFKSSYYYWDHGYGETTTKHKQHLVLKLVAMDRDLYLYYLTRMQDYTGDVGLFTEPVQIHNNVKNGIGIMGAHTEATKSIPIIFEK